MKKFIALLTLVVLFSATVNAQNKKGNNKRGNNFTAEQMATLQSKKLTLRLDLDQKQQKAVYEVMLKNSEERIALRAQNQQKRASGVKPTTEERYNMENLRLEKQIAQKTEMKKILTADQYSIWVDQMGKMNNKKNRNSKNNSYASNCNNSTKQYKNKI